MHLNHIDLCVPDVAAAATFFCKGFDFTVLNVVGEHAMAILRGGDGFVIVLTHDASASYPAAFHIGFLQPSREAVWAAHARLRAAGIDAPPPAEQHGALVFSCRVPGSIAVEISFRG